MPPEKQKNFPFDNELPRWSFIRLASLALALGFAALAAVFTLWTAAIARFLAPNATNEPDQTFKAGFPGEYPAGKVETKFLARYQTWIVSCAQNGRRKIIALRAVCTHLGCITLWNESENRFKCPCHGSGFNAEGVNLEGPAPRPLDRYAIRLDDGGQLEIDRAKVFCHQPGRECVPESFVEV
jgi:cytochrome b6-f complex iron-sulfur subunit